MNNAPLSLSICIIAFNEADRIGACLEALAGLSDDIVIIDSGSTDGTQAIAQSYGARVIHNDWVGYGPQKRFAEDQTKHTWLLNLDADEVVTPELKLEIAALLQTKPSHFGYRLHIVTVYPGHEKPRLFANEHNQIRLYDKTKMRFKDSLVHDSVDPGDHKIGQLRTRVDHFTFRSLAHFVEKQESYTSLQAKELRKPYWVLLLRMPFEYPLNLLRYLILRTHITGGLFGLNIAHIAAWYRTKRLWKIWNAKQAQAKLSGLKS